MFSAIDHAHMAEALRLAARGLYTSLGFEEIPPYYFNPVPGAHYLKAELDEPGTRW